MTFAIRADGAWTLVPYGQGVADPEGTQASYDTLLLWSEDERAAFGVFTVPELDGPPEGKVEASRTLGGDDRPAWVVIYADAPAPEPVAYTVYKADIWRRCTDDEATKLDAAIGSQPVRLRRLFDDATLLRSDDDLFGTIQGSVTQLLGADRAGAILAASA